MPRRYDTPHTPMTEGSRCTPTTPSNAPRTQLTSMYKAARMMVVYLSERLAWHARHVREPRHARGDASSARLYPLHAPLYQLQRVTERAAACHVPEYPACGIRLRASTSLTAGGPPLRRWPRLPALMRERSCHTRHAAHAHAPCAVRPRTLRHDVALAWSPATTCTAPPLPLLRCHQAGVR